MAGNDIKVDIQAMETCISSYNAAKGKMMECVLTYTTALASLATDYTGRAALAMSGKVNQMLGNIKASYEKIDDCVNELKSAIETYSTTETANAKVGSDVDKGSPFGA